MNRKNKKTILWITGLMIFLVAGVCGTFFYSQYNRTATDKTENNTYEFYQAKIAQLDSPEDVGVMILDCDDVSNYNVVVNAVTTHRTGKYVQGTGAMEIVDFFNVSPAYVNYSKVNISDYKDGSVHASIYVNDPKRLNDSPLILELSSSGTCDKQELSWAIPAGLFTEGWNDVYLALKDAIVEGEPDLTGLNYMRVYTLNTRVGLNVIIDSIYATDTEGMDITAIAEANKIFASTKKEMVLDFDSLEGLTSSGTISLSKAKGEYKEGKAAVLIQNPNELWIEANLKKLDLSAHQKGRLSFWVYINDAAHVKNGTICMELTSSGTYDKNEISWNFPGSDLKTGWNEVTLSIGTGNKTPDGIDFTNINYLRMYGVECSRDLCVILDGVTILPPAVRVASDGMLLDCDTEDKVKVSSTNAFTITTATDEHRQGAGAFKSVGKETIWWEVGMEELVDISAYKNGGLHLYLYISDVTKLKSIVAVELGSGGKFDVDEYQWNLSGLKTGWNELELPFVNAEVLGEPDLCNIDYFRVFAECNGVVTAILDDVRAANISFEIPPLKAGQLLNGDSLYHTTKLYGDTAVSVTNTAGEYKEGTGAYKSEGKGQVRIEAVFRETVDISAYKEGGISFWLYVGDKSQFTSEKIAVELSSDGKPDSSELEWKIPLSELKGNSWNEVKLSFVEAETVGNINLSAVNYFRIWFDKYEQSDKALLILDDVKAAEISVEIPSLKEGQLLSGDSLYHTTKLYGDTAVSVTNTAGEYKEGTGAYKSAGKGQVRIEAVFRDTVDISAYKEGGISFWLYVGDKSKFTSEKIAVELSSDGKPDSSELEWKIPLSELKGNSWNEVKLAFVEGEPVGNINLSAVNYFRIWMEQYEQSDKVLLILDDVKAANIQPEVPALKKGQLLSGDSLYHTTKLYGDTAVSVTNTAGEYKEGTGAYKSAGKGQVRIEAVLREAVDLSAYKDGGLSFWLYVGDKSQFKSPKMAVEISSDGKPDSSELEWKIPISELKENSWNQIALSFTDASTVGKINLGAVNYFRIWMEQYEQNDKALLIIDDVRGVEMNSKQLLNCDDESNATLHPWVPVTITKENGQYKEGVGAYKSVGAGQVRFQLQIKNAVDINAYRDGALSLWIYIGNKTVFASNTLCVELASSGESDKDELEWHVPLSELKENSWNEMKLSFEDAAEIGKINLGAVNYLRIYLNQNEQSDQVLLILDDVRAIDVRKEEKPELKAGQLLSCDNQFNVTKLYGDTPVSITNIVNEYKEGIGAYKSAGKGQVRFEVVLKNAVDLSGYKNGVLSFWLYVGDKAMFTSDTICIEISSAGTSDRDELEWHIPISELKGNSWNEIKLSFAAGTAVGKINLGAANYFRIYLNQNEQNDNVVLMLDDVHAVNMEKQLSAERSVINCFVELYQKFRKLLLVDLTGKK